MLCMLRAAHGAAEVRPLPAGVLLFQVCLCWCARLRPGWVVGALGVGKGRGRPSFVQPGAGVMRREGEGVAGLECCCRHGSVRNASTRFEGCPARCMHCPQGTECPVCVAACGITGGAAV